MLFLVIGEWVEPGVSVPLAQVATAIEHAVLPSLEIWAKWEDDGKVKGGVFAGERAGGFVIEAASSEEVGNLLSSMPFWGQVKWQVKPLQSVRSALERDRKASERMRASKG